MMRVGLLIFLTCLLSKASAVNWEKLGDLEYCIEPLHGNFKQATMACLNMNSTLAKVDTPEIHAFLTEYTMPPEMYYIGLKRITIGGEFKWVDGTALTYTSWYKGQPDRPEEFCVFMEQLGNTGYEWHDHTCSLKAGYICQRYVGNSTNSATLNSTATAKNVSVDGRIFNPAAKSTLISTSTQKGYVTSSIIAPQSENCKGQLTVIAVICLLLFVSICVNIALFCRTRPPAKKISEAPDHITYEVPKSNTSVRDNVYMNTRVGPNYDECENDYMAPIPGLAVQEHVVPDPDYVEFHPRNNF